MKKIICDKCGKEIKKADEKYIFATCTQKPIDGKLPPDKWEMVKEVCIECCLELQQLFS